MGAVPATSGPPGGEAAAGHASSTVRWADTSTPEEAARAAKREAHLAAAGAAGAEEAAAKRALTLEFLENFEGARGDGDGTVTFEEWCDYYGDLAAGVPDDALFIGILESAFMIVEAPGAEVDKELAAIERRLKAKVESKARM